MTALGGLDGLGPVAATTPSASRRPGVDASLLDALSGPDGTSDPAPWPIDTGGLTAVGDVFPDALTVDMTSGAPTVERPNWSLPDPRATAAAVAAPRPDPRSAPPAATARPAQSTRPTQTARPTQNPRPAQNTWSASGSGRPGQNAPRQAPPAARRTPAPARTAPTAPARPAYGSGSTGWSPGNQSARDLVRMARDAGGLGLAATPFLRNGDQRPTAARQPTRPVSAAQQQRNLQRSQWESRQSRPGAQRPARSTDPRTRRRSNGSVVFTVFVLAVVILFASGGAQAIIHLLTSLFGR